MTEEPSTSTSYLALPIRLKGSGAAAQPLRYLYLKPHSGNDTSQKDRALFVAGIPAPLDHDALMRLLSKFGEVERAAVHGSGLSAVIIYASPKGRDALLKAAAAAKATSIEVPPPQQAFGLKGALPAAPTMPGSCLESATCRYRCAQRCNIIHGTHRTPPFSPPCPCTPLQPG
jgi:hypothetical protein